MPSIVAGYRNMKFSQSCVIVRMVLVQEEVFEEVSQLVQSAPGRLQGLHFRLWPDRERQDPHHDGAPIQP